MRLCAIARRASDLLIPPPPIFAHSAPLNGRCSVFERRLSSLFILCLQCPARRRSAPRRSLLCCNANLPSSISHYRRRYHSYRYVEPQLSHDLIITYDEAGAITGWDGTHCPKGFSIQARVGQPSTPERYFLIYEPNAYMCVG